MPSARSTGYRGLAETEAATARRRWGLPEFWSDPRVRIPPMESAMTTPGFIDIEGVFDPESGDRKLLRMDLGRLNWLRKWAAPWITYSAPLVKAVLASPALVYEGLRREDQEEGRVYIGFPRHRYDNENRRLPVRRAEMFCVFHTPGGIVFEWRWVMYADGCDSIEDYAADNFGRKIWPRT